VAFTHGSRQRAGQVVEAPVIPGEPVDPPADITPEQLAVWALHAPDAIRAGTLTKQTARSFVHLVCASEVIYNRIMATLEADGWTYQKRTEMGTEPKTHPAQNRLEYWYRRIVDGHHEFKLAPFGRTVVEPARPVDPFAEFEAQA
jgi:hypothetical protein